MLISSPHFLFLAILVQLSNSLFLWEPRTLKCEEKRECFLSKNEAQDGWKTASCEEDSSGKYSCDLECDGAERDSVISKKPSVFRVCNRFYTYNTEHTSGGKWLLWRSGECAKANITMTVHCAFPFSSQ